MKLSHSNFFNDVEREDGRDEWVG